MIAQCVNNALQHINVRHYQEAARLLVNHSADIETTPENIEDHILLARELYFLYMR
jgi:hypothetical protein